MLNLLIFVGVLSTSVVPTQSEVGQATAVRPPLTFDSPMPIPDIEQWARGTAPDFNDKSKTFLISFWSSSITPARESLPRLSKLADQYRDQGLVIIGVTEEPAGGIQPLLDSPKFLEGIRFAIGCDPDRSTYRQFMSQSWQTTLPTAFLAHDGKIVWIGNPRDAKDVVAEVFAGTWSPESRRKAYEERANASKRATEFAKRLDVVMDRRQWDAALKVIAEMENDPNPLLAREGHLLRVSVLQQNEKTAEALEECDSLVATSKDWEVASEVAKMLASPLFPKPDLSRATVAALRGIAMSKQHEALAYYALAEVQTRSGQRDLAIRSLERALTLADPEEVDLIQERLADIQAPAIPAPTNSQPPANSATKSAPATP